MFGFSILPFSTSITKFVNGDEQGIILYINRTDSFENNICTVISITLEIEQDKTIEL
jgi:hypothetical protein